jgi:hypothetical protein
MLKEPNLVRQRVLNDVHRAVCTTFSPTLFSTMEAYKQLQQVPHTLQVAALQEHAAQRDLGGGYYVAGTSQGPAVVVFEGRKDCWLLDETTSCYAVMGSGGSVGVPFMSFVRRVLWGGKTPTVSDALLGVYWTLRHAIDHVATGVGGEPHLAVLRKDPAGKWVAERSGKDEIEGHARVVDAIEEAIRSRGITAVSAADAVPTPDP